METLSNVLYWLSTGLFVPVMLGTVIMFIYSLVLSGYFYGNIKEYLTYKKSVRQHMLKADVQQLSQLQLSSPKSEILPFVGEVISARHSKAAMERVLTEFEMKSDQALGRYKTLSKLGPILGLLGTLIPMGPALAGLGQGDVASMSWNMQVAFSTTVIGLFSGTIGFLMMQPKQRMLVSYLYDLEFLVNHFIEQNEAGNGLSARQAS